MTTVLPLFAFKDYIIFKGKDDCALAFVVDPLSERMSFDSSYHDPILPPNDILVSEGVRADSTIYIDVFSRVA